MGQKECANSELCLFCQLLEEPQTKRLEELTKLTIKHSSHRLNVQLWLFCLVGTVMATFTAALQCCLMDSSLAGASICVSILAGCLFGTEGESLQWEL